MSAVPESRTDARMRSARATPKTTIHRDAFARISALATAEQEGSLLVIGESGSGKSRLLSAVDPVAGVVTYRVRINPAEAEFPLSGLSAVVACFQGQTARELAAILLSPRDGHAHVAAHALELLGLIHDMTQPSTLLLIDDIDLMDHASQTVLAMVASRLGGAGLRLVATASARPTSGPLTSMPQVSLGQLGFADSLSLVAGLVHSQVDEAVLRVVVGASAGNPQALARNTRLLTPQQLASTAPLALPFAAAHRIPATTGDGPEAVRRRVLERLSCASLSSREVISVDTADTSSVVQELITDGSVISQGRYLSIADPLLRSELYWSMDPGARRALHAVAATAELAEAPGLAAWHRSWGEAGAVTTGELFSAATAFAADGFIRPAVEIAERALCLDHNSIDSMADLFELAKAMYERAELSHARRYARLAQRTDGAASIAPRLAILRTKIEFMANQQLLTAHVDDWVNTIGGDNADDGAYVLATLAICQTERWELDAAARSLSRVRPLLPRCSPETVELYHLAAMLLSAMQGDADPANKMFERVSRHAVTDTPVAALALLGRSLTFIDRHAEARRIFKAIIQLEPAPTPLWLVTAKYWLAENEIMAGNQFEALAMISQLDIATPDIEMHRSLHLLLMAWSWQVTGNRREADAAISECHRAFAAADSPALAAKLVAYQGRFALMDGRFEDAIAFLRMAASTGAGFKNPTLLRFEVDLIEACALSGRSNEAVEQFQNFQRRCLPYRTRWSTLAIARANAIVTVGEPAIAAFQQAIHLWHPGDPQFELGRIVLSYADRLAALGQQREAKEQYLAARMIFTQLGAMTWARKAEAPQPARNVRQEHPLLASLGADERLVADLVCRGLRNKEIAAELFVSLRTVEVRLTRIYHRLGARSRAHLTAMLTSADTGVIEQTAGLSS
jgi:DNA-binding CsgD family transcriptional regulator